MQKYNGGMCNILKPWKIVIIFLHGFLDLLISQEVCYAFLKIPNPGSCDLFIRDITDNNFVLFSTNLDGWNCDDPEDHFIYSINTNRVEPLNIPEFYEFYPYAINFHGTVVGTALRYRGRSYKGFRFFLDSFRLTQISEPNSVFTRITNSDIAFGYRYVLRNNKYFPEPIVNFKQGRQYKTIVLKTLKSEKKWVEKRIFSMNEYGVGVGSASRVQFRGREVVSKDKKIGYPVIWDNFKKVARPLPAGSLGLKLGSAMAVNNRGDVVGKIMLRRVMGNPVYTYGVWWSGRNFEELTYLAGADDVKKFFITDNGDIFANVVLKVDNSEYEFSILGKPNGNFNFLGELLREEHKVNVIYAGHIFDVNSSGIVGVKLLMKIENSEDDDDDFGYDEDEYTEEWVEGLMIPVSCS